MGAMRTLLNKRAQGRKPGPLALARFLWPVSRQRRMNTPHGTISLTPERRIELYKQGIANG